MFGFNLDGALIAPHWWSGGTHDHVEEAFAVVIGHEGGFCVERTDPGNWTGGAVGRGVLRGTKFGISAAAYPTQDIANLTPEAAATIYRRDYWNRVLADHLRRHWRCWFLTRQ